VEHHLAIEAAECHERRRYALMGAPPVYRETRRARDRPFGRREATTASGFLYSPRNS
jgi:hypothetical protein